MATAHAATDGHPDSAPVHLSVVIPCYNEEDLLERAHARVQRCLERLGETYEIIYVDDGSRDRSYAILEEIQKRDAAVRVVRLSRNFGHQIAITAGLDESSGAAVVILDADLQDPPELIEEMVRRWKGGAQVVYGVRRGRAGESALRIVVTDAFYKVMTWLSDVPLCVEAADFRLMDRCVVNILREMLESDRYLRGMVPWIGFTQVAVTYEREPRIAGERKYTLAKLAKLAMDGVTSCGNPMRLCFAMTFVIFAASVAFAAAALFFPLAGTLSAMALVGALFSIQLFWLGLLGEYVVRSFRAGRRRPLYIVHARLGSSRAMSTGSGNGSYKHGHQELIHV